MTDEAQEQTGQEAEPSDPGQAVDSFMDVDGQKYSLDEAQNAIREYRTWKREDYQGKYTKTQADYENYRKTMDPIQDRYNNDPSFAQQFDELWANESGGRPSPVSIDNRRLDALEQKIAQQEHRERFQGLRDQNYQVSKEDELKVLQKMHEERNYDVEATYLKLFARREMERFAKSKEDEAINQMAENQNSVPSMPKGGRSKAPASKDIRELYKDSPEKFDDALLARIQKDMFGG
jgi:hypothetical protein